MEPEKQLKIVAHLVNLLIIIVVGVLVFVLSFLIVEQTKFGVDLSSALGSIATFATFIILLIKDKFKQDQLDRLTAISSSLEAQNDTMKQHNDLVAQQVDILRNVHFEDGNNSEVVNKLHAIEEKKLKLMYRPDLWLNGASTSGIPGRIKIDLNNKGEYARLLQFNLIAGDITLTDLHLPYDLNNGERRYIFAVANGHKAFYGIKFEIDVVYKDRLDNFFKSTIKGDGPYVKIGDPIEIEPIVSS